MTLDQLNHIYSALGGVFVSPISKIQSKLAGIKAFIFDWDGVFNDGRKGVNLHSSYTEGDSMGTNLLRFGYWLSHGQQLPVTGIITGANNETARAFAKREHFEVVYSGYKNKLEAFQHLLETHHLQAHEVAFCFDDVLDLSMAQQCGLRFLIRRNASPVFQAYVAKNGLCDYVSASEGDRYAIREISELLLSCMGVYDTVIEKRMAYEGDYAAYLADRNREGVVLFNHADIK